MKRWVASITLAVTGLLMITSYQNCSGSGFTVASLGSSSGIAGNGADGGPGGSGEAPPTEKICRAPVPVSQEPELYDCESGSAVAGPLAYSLSLAGKANGDYAANAFSNEILTAPSKVVTPGAWGASPTTRFLQPANQNYLLARSRYCSRDMEVSTFSQLTMVYLRLSKEGNGIYFGLNRDTNGLEVGFVSKFKEGVAYRYGDVGDFIGMKSLPLTSIAGYDPAVSEGQVFTFGVSGMDAYAKFNGVEVLRLSDYRFVQSGRAAVQPMAATGIRDFSVKHLPTKKYSSNLLAKVLDLREFGLKSIKSTGSITEGSKQLVLAAAADFRVGDSIIVEIGKEPGQGHRGTMGVGGSWPKLRYNTLAEMQADKSKENATYASFGADIYRFFTDTWYKQDPITVYYASKIVPTALMAKITAVSGDGKTLTLDTAAQASATVANVYYDNTPVFNALGRGEPGGVVPEGVTLYIAPGEYAIGTSINIGGRKGWKIEGAGQDKTLLFSPKGADSANLQFFQSPKSEVRNFHFKGNMGDEGYGMGQYGYPSGINFTLSDDGLAEDLTVTDVWMGAVGVSMSKNTWARRATNYQNWPFRTYVQWMFVWADSTGGGCVDCHIFSKWMIPGFETFRSTGISFIRPVAENASFSTNSSGDFLIENAYVTIKAMTQFEDSDVSFHRFNPLINVNSNIDNSSGSGGLVQKGGTIRNMNIVQEGPFNTKKDNLKGVVINDTIPNVIVQGGYFQAPDYDPAIGNLGANAVNGESLNTNVDGLRVVGRPNPDSYPGASIVIKTGSIKNCVADTFRINDGTPAQGCVTNAQAGNPPALRPRKPLVEGEACVLKW